MRRAIYKWNFFPVDERILPIGIGRPRFGFGRPGFGYRPPYGLGLPFLTGLAAGALLAPPYAYPYYPYYPPYPYSPFYYY